jgi:ABC-type molybdate transport system substrate-binding protein
MAKVKKAQFGVSKSDSLMKESNKKKAFANTQEKIGSSLVKKGLGDKKQTYWDNEGRLGIGKQKTMPTGKERLELAKKARAEAKKDSIASVKAKTMKSGGKQMLKRADGSYSQRGLWDNIRANKGSGKKPTAQMLKQEKKIKAKSKK